MRAAAGTESAHDRADLINTVEMRAGTLSLATLRQIYEQPTAVRLTAHDRARIAEASALVAKIVAAGEAAYGINTGFGLLAQTRIPSEQLELLQRNLLLSHAAGVGDALPDSVVRLTLALKINALARGHSGISSGLMDALLALLEHGDRKSTRLNSSHDQTSYAVF